jgi:hypothetical protein
MPRSYSEEFVMELYKKDPEDVGIALARACVVANLPAIYVAAALDVSRVTVFNWFRGKVIRHNNLLRVKTFTDLVESDTAKGLLPARNLAHAKSYLEEMTGKKF